MIIHDGNVADIRDFNGADVPWAVNTGGTDDQLNEISAPDIGHETGGTGGGVD